MIENGDYVYNHLLHLIKENNCYKNNCYKNYMLYNNILFSASSKIWNHEN